MEEEYKMPPQYTEKQDKYKKRTNADFIVKSGIFIFLAALGILGAMITLFVISRGIPYELVVNYMWIFWLWIPLPIMSVIFGIKQGKTSIEPDYETIFRYLIYNGTTEEYNCLPQTKGKYRMYVMMFDGLKNHLEINEYDYVYIK